MVNIVSNHKYINVIYDKEYMVRITLCRAEKRNALTVDMVAELMRLCVLIKKESSIRMLVIAGNENIFCAGFDVYQLRELSDPQVKKFNLDYAKLLNHLISMPQVLVVEVAGGAYGGGMGFLACADFVLAETKAKFAMPEVRLGLLPSQILPYVVAKIGMQSARRLSLFAQEISAAEALRIGLVDELVDTNMYFHEAENRLYSHILSLSSSALVQTKRLLFHLSGLNMPDYVENAANEFLQAFTSQAGVRIDEFLREKVRE